YNAFRNLLRQVSPRWPEQDFDAFTTYHEYDKRDQRTRTIDALGNTTDFEYTSRGDLSAQIDARGVATDYVYTGLRLLHKQVVQALGGAVVQTQYYRYDINKNRTLSCDPVGNLTYFYYDVLNR